jgi:hypothetical protein
MTAQSLNAPNIHSADYESVPSRSSVVMIFVKWTAIKGLTPSSLLTRLTDCDPDCNNGAVMLRAPCSGLLSFHLRTTWLRVMLAPLRLLPWWLLCDGTVEGLRRTSACLVSIRRGGGGGAPSRGLFSLPFSRPLCELRELLLGSNIFEMSLLDFAGSECRRPSFPGAEALPEFISPGEGHQSQMLSPNGPDLAFRLVD